MKQEIKNLLLAAARRAYEQGALSTSELPPVEVGTPRFDSHGDFSTNIAMVMAAVQKMPPRKIARALVDWLDDSGSILASVGNCRPRLYQLFLSTLPPGCRYSEHPRAGPPLTGPPTSARPQGPGRIRQRQSHRSPACGAWPRSRRRRQRGQYPVFCGYNVQREYYINDSGRQIRTLGRSVFLRYQQLFGQQIAFPQDCYQGDYIVDIATEIKAAKGAGLLDEGDNQAIDYCARYAADKILAGIKEDLGAFGVFHDNWFSEQSLFDSGEVERVISDFRQKEIIYAKDDALWFNTSRFGDEKDRVVVRNNGLTTYFASDIAYHHDKFERGFERIIDVWGADHHGYIPRLMASVEAMRLQPGPLRSHSGTAGQPAAGG